MLRRKAFRFTPWFLCVCSLGLCQSMALLTGAVSDPSGAAIAHAVVKCWNTETNLRLTVITNPEGIFRFPDLPVGQYEPDISQTRRIRA